jgi:hypothetical protein
MHYSGYDNKVGERLYIAHPTSHDPFSECRAEAVRIWSRMGVSSWLGWALMGSDIPISHR